MKLSKNVILLSLISVILGSYFLSRNLYLRASLWIYQSDVIRKDTGNIVWISSKGRKTCSYAFGDGRRCSIALEVRGENGVGTFHLGNTFMNGFSTEFYFNVGSWIWNEKTTQIRQDGMTVEDYYSPEHYLEVLNAQIAKSDAPIYYYERAQIQLLLDAPDLAYRDIQRAISQFNNETAPNFLDSLRVKALIQSELKEYDQSLETMEQVIKLNREQNRTLSEDLFLRWILQNEAGQTKLADQMLERVCGVGADLIFKPIDYSSPETRILLDGPCRNLHSSSYEGYKLYKDDNYSQAKLQLQEELRCCSRQRFNHDTLLAKLVLARISDLPPE